MDNRRTPALSLLLVNLYHEAGDEKIVPYREQLAEAATLARVALETTIVRHGDLPTDCAEFAAVVLSGSHRMISTGEYDEPLARWVSKCPIPLLGICYGHQLLAKAFGGAVVKDRRRHDGPEELSRCADSPLLDGLPARFVMAESHEEVVEFASPLAERFHRLATNAEGGTEAIVHHDRPLFGVQFHPERSGGPGRLLLANFLRLAASR